jgi:hypothetical protein
MKRRTTLAALGVSTGAIVVAVSSHFIFRERVHVVLLEGEQIQRTLDARFPVRVESSPGEEVVLVRCQLLTRHFSDLLATSTEFEAAGQPGRGRIQSDARLRYDSNRGGLYLSSPILRTTSTPSAHPRFWQDACARATASLRELQSEILVHPITDEGLKRLLAGASLREVKWFEGRLVVTFGY